MPFSITDIQDLFQGAKSAGGILPTGIKSVLCSNVCSRIWSHFFLCAKVGFEIWKVWFRTLVFDTVHQGDLEASAGLPISPQVIYFLQLIDFAHSHVQTILFVQCDRKNTSLAKSQAAFISFVVLPAYKVI